MSWPVTHKSNPRDRYRPFRLLAVILYGRHPDLLEIRPGSELVINSIYRLSHMLHMRSERLREDLKWLEKSGYISGLWWVTEGKGARFKIESPVNLRRDTP